MLFFVIIIIKKINIYDDIGTCCRACNVAMSEGMFCWEMFPRYHTFIISLTLS